MSPPGSHLNLNGNTFLITNKTYGHANIAQWGTGGRDMGTYEKKLYPAQFWRLEEDSTHAGWFYINNVAFDTYRIGKWGSGDGDVGIFSGNYYDDQMWKFTDQGNGYYRIFNYKYQDAKIAKWGNGDGDWGTYAGDDYDAQLWKLTPRYQAQMREDIIWECDNRAGSLPYSETVKVTSGIKLTDSSSLTTKVGIEVSLKQAASMELSGTSGFYSGKASQSVELKQKISSEISHFISSSEEKSWSKENEITFTAPAHKNYRVRQSAIRFNSPLSQDNLDMKCKYRIEQSDGDFFD